MFVTYRLFGGSSGKSSPKAVHRRIRQCPQSAEVENILFNSQAEMVTVRCLGNECRDRARPVSARQRRLARHL